MAAQHFPFFPKCIVALTYLHDTRPIWISMAYNSWWGDAAGQKARHDRGGDTKCLQISFHNVLIGSLLFHTSNFQPSLTGEAPDNSRSVSAVFKFLAANARFIHETALGQREHHDAFFILGIFGDTGGDGHRADLGAELK